MATKTDIEFMRINDRTWLMLNNVGTRSFTITESPTDGRFYLWSDEVVQGRSCWGVYPNFTEAKMQIQIFIQKGDRKL